MIEFLFIFFGILLGCIAGLLPGIHTNLISVLLLNAFFPFSSLNLSLLIVSMTLTQSFVSIIPSLFFGIPEEESVQALLPGHKLVIKGFGCEAIKLYLLGGIFSLIFILILTPLLFHLLPDLFSLAQKNLKLFLSLIIVFIILKEPFPDQKILAFFVFFASGLLGYLTFDKVNEPLLVLFSGFFAVSSLLFSFSTSFPKQLKTDIIRLSPSTTFFSLCSVCFSSSLVNLFPGLGISQALSLSRFFFFRLNDYAYLFIIGGASVVDFIFSLITFYLFNKHRNGSIVAVSSFIPILSFDYFLLFIAVLFLVSGIAVLLTLYIANLFINSESINIILLNKLIFAFLILIVFYFSGIIGLFVLFLATLIGIVAQLSGICRSHCMGCLLLVVLLN